MNRDSRASYGIFFEGPRPTVDVIAYAKSRKRESAPPSTHTHTHIYIHTRAHTPPFLFPFFFISFMLATCVCAVCLVCLDSPRQKDLQKEDLRSG